MMPATFSEELPLEKLVHAYLTKSLKFDDALSIQPVMRIRLIEKNDRQRISSIGNEDKKTHYKEEIYINNDSMVRHSIDLLRHGLECIDAPPKRYLTRVWHPTMNYHEIDRKQNTGFITNPEKADSERYMRLLRTGKVNDLLYSTALIGMSDPEIMKRFQILIKDFESDPEAMGKAMIGIVLDKGPEFFARVNENYDMTYDESEGVYSLSNRKISPALHTELTLDENADLMVIDSKTFKDGELLERTKIHDVEFNETLNTWMAASFTLESYKTGKKSTAAYTDVSVIFFEDSDEINDEFEIVFSPGATILDASENESRQYIVPNNDPESFTNRILSPDDSD